MSTSEFVVLRRKDIVIPTLDNLSRPFGRSSAMLRSRTPMEWADFGPEFDQPPSIKVEKAELSSKELNDLRRDSQVIAAAPSMPLEPIASTEINVLSEDEARSLSSSTWGVKAVRADESPYDGKGVTVAVLDTGIAPTHPAFTGIDLQRRNFTSEGDDDINGHGTHCAGTIFGQDIGQLRIGIARGLKKVLIGKVIGAGGGTSLTIADAISWAVENNANIVSMSLGIDFPRYVDGLVNGWGVNIREATSIALEAYRANVNLFTQIARLAQERGVLIVAASGNASRRSPAAAPNYEIAVAPPAAGTGVVAVGALAISADDKLDVAAFSNNQVNIAAPGVGVISAWPSSGGPSGTLASLNGTSMATPHVAGVAALWAQRQLQKTGRVDYITLMAQLIASETTAPLVANIGADDVGTGIVQSPLD